MAQCDILKEAKWGESCVPLALCTSVLLLQAIEHILGIILAVTYVCLMSTSGDARVLSCKRPSIQEESEGVRVNGTVRVQEVCNIIMSHCGGRNVSLSLSTLACWCRVWQHVTEALKQGQESLAADAKHEVSARTKDAGGCECCVMLPPPL